MGVYGFDVSLTVTQATLFIRYRIFFQPIRKRVTTRIKLSGNVSPERQSAAGDYKEHI